MARDAFSRSAANFKVATDQAYNEAKSNADRLAPGLVAEYDHWKYDSRDYAVVDLGLTRAQVWDKFAGAEKGVAARNVAAGGRPASLARVLGASLANRFAAMICGVRGPLPADPAALAPWREALRALPAEEVH